MGSGLTYVEAGSFVSPKWVPQMGNSGEVFRELEPFIAANPQATFAGLTPNMKGLEGALSASCKEVAIFAAASESFSKKNINMTIEQAMAKQGEVATAALAEGLYVLACDDVDW